MANPRHLELILQGIPIWNKWRDFYQDIIPDLSNANLSHFNLSGANLSRTDLSRANLVLGDLSAADLSKADLFKADLTCAKLIGANCTRADFIDTNLILANLHQANLTYARLVGTNLRDAELIEANIYGISAWDVLLEGTKQSELIITQPGDTIIKVDTIEAAQIIYQWRNNENIEKFFTATSGKVVLLLGRFTPERKAILDVVKNELRKHGYLPAIFDFKKPQLQDLTGVVTALAHLSRFVIADITDPKCVTHELAFITPLLRTVPIQPILQVPVQNINQASSETYAMFPDLQAYPWCLPIHLYKGLEDLLETFKLQIIDPAEKKINDLTSLIKG